MRHAPQVCIVQQHHDTVAHLLNIDLGVILLSSIACKMAAIVFSGAASEQFRYESPAHDSGGWAA